MGVDKAGWRATRIAKITVDVVLALLIIASVWVMSTVGGSVSASRRLAGRVHPARSHNTTDDNRGVLTDSIAATRRLSASANVWTCRCQLTSIAAAKAGKVFGGKPALRSRARRLDARLEAISAATRS